MDHFRNEWLEKHKIDAYTNPKAMFRLRAAADKQKKILSANDKAPISIECFMDDIDVKGMMEREVFAEMCVPLFEKCQKLIEKAFADCGLPTGYEGECMFMAELDFSSCYDISVGGGTWDTEISWRLVAPDGYVLLEAGAPVELTLGDCVE